MKQFLTNPVVVKIELSLFEDIIKIIAGAIHPQVNGGQIHSLLNNLISVRENAISEQTEKQNAETR